MKKNKGAAGSKIFSLWEKASKAKKTDDTSTPNQTIVAASSICHVQVESNLQLTLVQPPDAEPEPTPIVEDAEASDEDAEPMEADLEVQPTKHEEDRIRTQ